MPALLIEAQRVAHTVTHGTMAAGAPGLARPSGSSVISTQNDARAGIDWRRSASSDHLFVREREWEAAHTVWLWIDLSPSMRFRSSLSKTPRKAVPWCWRLRSPSYSPAAASASAFLAPGLHRARNASRRVAEILVGDTSKGSSLPPPATLSRFSECLLFSDFLEPVAEKTAARFEEIAGQGVRGHLVQILDPAEETLPYDGRTEFAASEGRDRVIAGRAENLRERYQERLKRTPQRDLAADGAALGLVLPRAPHRPPG